MKVGKEKQSISDVYRCNQDGLHKKVILRDRALGWRFPESILMFLTFIGLLINAMGAAWLLAVGQFRWSRGTVILGAGLFDMVDGRVARATNRVTPLRRILRLGAGPLFRPGPAGRIAGLVRDLSTGPNWWC